MKYSLFIAFFFLSFIQPSFAADTATPLHDVAAPKVKSFFASFDGWRQEKAIHFGELKDKNKESLAEQDLAKQKQLDAINELNPDSLPHTNYLGKGDNAYLSRPMTVARVELFSFLEYLFIHVLLFYGALILAIFLIVRYFWIHFF